MQWWSLQPGRALQTRAGRCCHSSALPVASMARQRGAKALCKTTWVVLVESSHLLLCLESSPEPARCTGHALVTSAYHPPRAHLSSEFPCMDRVVTFGIAPLQVSPCRLAKLPFRNALDRGEGARWLMLSVAWNCRLCKTGLKSEMV